MKKQKSSHEDLLASQLPNLLHYHMKMLSDGPRNKQLAAAVRRHVTPEISFLDIGAGTGIWAILAAKLGAKRVVAIEIEESLIPIIHKHSQENGVADRIEIILGDSRDVSINERFDVIVSELFGSHAYGQETVESFVDVRSRFLATDGVLIPSRLTMLAVPVCFGGSGTTFPPEVAISSEYIQKLSTNYPQNLAFFDRARVEFLAEPEPLFEIDFRTVTNAPVTSNLKAAWDLTSVSKANGVVTFDSSTFDEDLVLSNFESKSWASTLYGFSPFSRMGSGQLQFDLNLSGRLPVWSVSVPEAADLKQENYSPGFSAVRLKMAAATTPYRRFSRKKKRSAR